MNVTPLRLSRFSLFFVDLGLLLVALSWGASYSLMQLIIQSGVGVPLFLMLRFALAIPFLFAVKIDFRNLKTGEIVNGVVFGVLLYAILTFETLGVKNTTASNAGFLIVLSVILVPIFERVLGKKRKSVLLYFACLLSIIGAALLCFSNAGKLEFNKGDLLILAAALIRGYQIYMFGKQTSGKNYSLVNITFIELVVVALLGLCSLLLFSPTSLSAIPDISITVWSYIIFLSFFATAFAFLMQLYAAEKTSPTRVGIILSLEPIFAALCAVAIVGDNIGLFQILGGGIIVLAAFLGRFAEGKAYE